MAAMEAGVRETPRRRIPAGERRAQIMRVAGGLFARDGYAGTRIDDIAAAAEVTKPIVYRHFDSKKALYMALLAKHEEDLPTFTEGLSGTSAPPLDADTLVRTILEHWLDYVRENQHAWLMLFRDRSDDEEIERLRRRVSLRAREVLVAFIAQQAGSRMPSEEIEPTADALRSGLAGLALWWIDHPDVPKPVLVNVGVRMTRAAVTGG
jgi:AcrR family transcriptional regulator